MQNVTIRGAEIYGFWTPAQPSTTPYGPFVIGLNTYGDAMLEYQTTALTEHFSQTHHDYRRFQNRL